MRPTGDDDQDVTAPQLRILRRPTVLISSSDTLVSLAEALFHDPNLGWLIADLNADRISESFHDGKRVIEVRSRQELIMPVWQDIVAFNHNRDRDGKPENLVTIVIESQVDRELIANTLDVVMGGTNAKAPQPVSPSDILATGFTPSLSGTTPLAPDTATASGSWIAQAGLSLKTYLTSSDRRLPPPSAPATVSADPAP